MELWDTWLTFIYVTHYMWCAPLLGEVTFAWDDDLVHVILGESNTCMWEDGQYLSGVKPKLKSLGLGYISF